MKRAHGGGLGFRRLHDDKKKGHCRSRSCWMNDSSCIGKMQTCADACGGKAGKSSTFPDPSLHHHIGKSSDSRPLRSIYHFHRSSFLLFEKYAQGPVKSCFCPMAFFALVARGIMIGCWNILGRNVFTPKPLQKSFHERCCKAVVSRIPTPIRHKK